MKSYNKFLISESMNKKVSKDLKAEFDKILKSLGKDIFIGNDVIYKIMSESYNLGKSNDKEKIKDKGLDTIFTLDSSYQYNNDWYSFCFKITNCDSRSEEQCYNALTEAITEFTERREINSANMKKFVNWFNEKFSIQIEMMPLGYKKTGRERMFSYE
jgi:hypothetical protein